MCESNAYYRREGREELVLSDIARVTFEGDQIVLTGVLGNQKKVRAEIVEFDLMGHKLILRERR